MASWPRAALTRAAIPVAGSPAAFSSATSAAPARAGLRRERPGDGRGCRVSSLRQRARCTWTFAATFVLHSNLEMENNLFRRPRRRTAHAV